jgi:putative addiction module component (TIGR02574 family)
MILFHLVGSYSSLPKGYEMTTAKLTQLSVVERLKLIEEIWESIDQESEFPPLTEAQQHELDRRMEAYEQGLDQGYTWEEIVSKVRKNNEL